MQGIPWLSEFPCSERCSLQEEGAQRTNLMIFLRR